MRARITKEITAPYSMTTNPICTHTVGRIPRIASQSRTPMMAVATSQVTGLANVCVGVMTKSR